MPLSLSSKLVFGWLLPTVGTALLCAYVASLAAAPAFGAQLDPLPFILLFASLTVFVVILVESAFSQRLDRFAWSLAIIPGVLAIESIGLMPQNPFRAQVLFWAFSGGSVVVFPLSIFRKWMEEAKEEDARRRETEERGD